MMREWAVPEEAAPSILGEVMAELFGLIAAGVLSPRRPHPIPDGSKALSDLASRATVGRLVLLP